jgi:drug/metabolite transporter (DMT)-like permease
VFGVLAVRFILAGLCLLPALRAIRWQAWRAGLPMGGILLAILLCETWALQYTSASNAAFLISLCLVLTPLAEWLLYGQRPAARIWALVGLSWLGALLLTGDSAMHFSGGDALMLLAAVLRAFGVCWLKQLADRQPATAQALTAMQCWTVGLGALALSASQGGLPALPHDPDFWLAISYLAVLCTVCAFAIQNYALRRSDPSRVALLMGSEPVFGALAGDALQTRSRADPLVGPQPRQMAVSGHHRQHDEPRTADVGRRPFGRQVAARHGRIAC